MQGVPKVMITFRSVSRRRRDGENVKNFPAARGVSSLTGQEFCLHFCIFFLKN